LFSSIYAKYSGAVAQIKNLMAVSFILILHRNILCVQGVEMSCNYRWFGTSYGGFNVCTDLLDAKKKEPVVVYSGGVDRDVSFDL